MDKRGLRLVLFYPFPRRGGIERAFFNLSAELTKRLPDTKGLTFDGDPYFLAHVRPPARVESARLPLRWLERAAIVPRDARNGVRILAALVRNLRQARPDVVLAFQFGVLAVAANRLTGSRAAVVIRESNTPSVAVAGGRGLVWRVKLGLKRMAYRRAAYVIAVSEGVRQDVLRRLGLPAARVVTIYNISDREEIRRQASEPVDHPWFADGAGVPVIVSAGRLSHEKDHATLIRAFAEVVKRHEARLLILGEGSRRGRLEALVRELGLEDRVWMPGFIENPFPYVARASVFAFSSVYEGVGNALIEAQMCGVPIVSTDCPSGPREILADGAAGTLVPVGDAPAMAEAIARYLREPELARGHVARATALLSRFSAQVVGEQYQSVVERAAVEWR
ncbi:MAG: glycosyltransferase [SAR202 cluster bacterium]|nr:glycosyltransferase [SAR202 cluster bacterium]